MEGATTTDVETGNNLITESSAGRNKARTFIMLGLALGVLIASLDATVVSTSLPRIVGDLGGISLFSWVIIAYLLSSTVTMPIAGKMSDRYGRKPIFMIGTGVFLVGSVLAGMSQNMNELILFRFLQGFGAGILMVIALTVVADFYAPSERGKIQGLLGAVGALSFVIGPFIGGYLVDNIGWRWVFYVNLPIGLICIALTAMKFPRQDKETRKPIDYLGMVSLSASLLAFLLVMSWGGSTYPWNSVEIIGLSILSVAALIAFLLIEQRANDPVLPLRLFRQPVFSLSCLGLFFVGIGLFAVLAFLPLFLQAVLGMSATYSGETLIPLMIGLIIMAMVSGFALKKTGYRIWLILGPPVAAVGLYLLSTLGVGSSHNVAIAYTVIIGLGLGMIMATYIVAAQNVLNKNDMGIGTSATKLFQQIGGTIGVTLLGTLVNRQMVTELGKNLPAGAAAVLPSTDANTLGGLLLNPKAAARIPAPILDAIRLSLSNSLTYTFLVAAVFVLAALVVSIFIKSIPLKNAEEYHNGKEDNNEPENKRKNDRN